MTVTLSAALGIAFGLSEGALTVLKRSRAESAKADRGSLVLLWVVICCSILVSIGAAQVFPDWQFGGSALLDWIAAMLFVTGLALRWYAIIHLGRFFTVDVAIASDHQVVDTGPCRVVRHPSYTGALTAFVGLALSIGNALSVLLLLVPVTAVFLHRIRVEETALRDALGDPYISYARRTKKLIPLFY